MARSATADLEIAAVLETADSATADLETAGAAGEDREAAVRAADLGVAEAEAVELAVEAGTERRRTFLSGRDRARAPWPPAIVPQHGTQVLASLRGPRRTSAVPEEC